MNKIKEIRMENGLTQAELSEMTGLKQQYLSSLENDKRDILGISTGNSLKIAHALGCTIEALIGLD